jgi:hypothetical protein
LPWTTPIKHAHGPRDIDSFIMILFLRGGNHFSEVGAVAGEQEVPGWGIRLQEDVKGLRATVEDLAESNSVTHGKLWDAIDKIKEGINNRLPLWATFLIGGLMSLATWGLTHK